MIRFDVTFIPLCRIYQEIHMKNNIFDSLASIQDLTNFPKIRAKV